MNRVLWAAVGVFSACAAAAAEELSTDRVERGRQALLGRNFVPPAWKRDTFDNLWKTWGLSEKPADFDRAVRDRYGLHEAPYPNDGLPMGLRPASVFLVKGISSDCMICHAGSIAGSSHVGLGNSTLDIHALFDDLNRSQGRNVKLPFRFTTVRGTSEAGGMGVYLLGLRNPDLSLRKEGRLELGLRDDLCGDPPAWWLLKKKRTMYVTGGTDARSVRSLMQFMLSPLNGPAAFEEAEPAFRDMQAYILSLTPPKYPLPIDREKAARGERVFNRHCASCHGTYGPDGSYPNKIIPLSIIGTDRVRYDGISADFGRYYTRSWFAREYPGWFHDDHAARASTGYQAPPLDGIWATAPYLHNGSVPTVYHLLNSESRPTIFTRSFQTGLNDYDPVKLGWKVTELERPADPQWPEIEQRKVYDTRKSGRGNGGHTFGDRLDDDERWAVIEYLKTL